MATFEELCDPAQLAFDPEALRAKYREERDKRLRADGNEQYREVVGDFSRYVDEELILERPHAHIFEPEFVDGRLHQIQPLAGVK